MSNLISGLIAMALIVVFLGYLGVIIAAIPLGIIIVIVLLMAVTDFVQSVKNGNSKSGS